MAVESPGRLWKLLVLAVCVTSALGVRTRSHANPRGEAVSYRGSGLATIVLWSADKLGGSPPGDSPVIPSTLEYFKGRSDTSLLVETGFATPDQEGVWWHLELQLDVSDDPTTWGRAETMGKLREFNGDGSFTGALVDADLIAESWTYGDGELELLISGQLVFDDPNTSERLVMQVVLQADLTKAAPGTNVVPPYDDECADRVCGDGVTGPPTVYVDPSGCDPDPYDDGYYVEDYDDGAEGCDGGDSDDDWYESEEYFETSDDGGCSGDTVDDDDSYDDYDYDDYDSYGDDGGCSGDTVDDDYDYDYDSYDDSSSGCSSDSDDDWDSDDDDSSAFEGCEGTDDDSDDHWEDDWYSDGRRLQAAPCRRCDRLVSAPSRLRLGGAGWLGIVLLCGLVLGLHRP